MSKRSVPFDAQAETYDRRVGLSEPHCQAIVQAVLALVQPRPEDLLFEVGAGTGMLGIWFARAPLRYLGLDLSRGMLTAFHRRLEAPGDTMLLLQADGNARWPLAAATVRVIFSSRALHLLDPKHIVRESFRVAQPEGTLCLMGRIHRQEDSVAAMMQRQLQRLLYQYGYPGRAGLQHQQALLASYSQQGAIVLDPMVVVRWTVTRTPAQGLDAWQSKPGLGGIDLPPHVKRAILHDLSTWAKGTFGDLQHARSSEEAYVLQGVRLWPVE